MAILGRWNLILPVPFSCYSFGKEVEQRIEISGPGFRIGVDKKQKQ
jgi:hypothetical protein